MTETQIWLSRRYLIYKLLSNMWFVGVIWLFYYRLFITDAQVGILDSIAFCIGLFAEVPTGVLADKFGRDYLVRIGQILIGVGLLVQVIGQTFHFFIFGQSIVTIGLSFVSGADEALFFNRLNFSQDSVAWRKLVTRGSQAGLIGSLICVVIGGWLFSINPQLPWYLNGIIFILAAVVVWPVKDLRKTHVIENTSSEIMSYLKNIRQGFSYMIRSNMSLYIPIIVTVQGLFYTMGFGLLRPMLLSRFHFNPFWSSFVVAACGLLTIGVLSLMHNHAERVREKYVLVLISLTAAVSLLLSIADIGIWGFVVILVLYVGEHVLYPFMSEILNKNALENQRATVLSVASFMRTLPYVILAPVIGYLNTQNHLDYFLGIWAFCIGGAVMMYVVRKKQDERIVVKF